MSAHEPEGSENYTTRESIFQFLVNYKQRCDGNPPSLQEIAESCAVSISTANYHLTRLEVEGRITIWGNPRRQIAITGGTWQIHTSPNDDRFAAHDSHNDTNLSPEQNVGSKSAKPSL